MFLQAVDTSPLTASGAFPPEVLPPFNIYDLESIEKVTFKNWNRTCARVASVLAGL
jgi:hypothetical protein